MKKDFAKTMVWVTRDKQEYRLCDMARTHVQNSLQWCMRNKPSPFYEMSRGGETVEFVKRKDGYTYDEWIIAFTVRLLDPACV